MNAERPTSRVTFSGRVMLSLPKVSSPRKSCGSWGGRPKWSSGGRVDGLEVHFLEDEEALWTS